MNMTPQPRVSAHWAVLGKLPGVVMGYEVLGGSLGYEQAGHFLWGAVTGTPEASRPGSPDALPWRVFLSGVAKEPTAVAARVETVRDSRPDGTNRISNSSRLLLVDWDPACTVGLTWSALDRAAADVPWDPERFREQTGSAAAMALTVTATTAAEFAQTVDRIGFAWAAGVAALLLDGRQVVVTLPSGDEPPSTDTRVMILDAVCSLLPYGCRTWLSAATWAGHTADHTLRLVFAHRTRNSQCEARLHGPLPVGPSGQIARTYLHELCRLREERESTSELIAHLMSLTAPIAYQQSERALSGLRELNLLEAVLLEIREGRGEPVRVGQLLDQRSVLGLDGSSREQLIVFLVTCAAGTADHPPVDRSRAAEVLERHWHPDDVRHLATVLQRRAGQAPPTEQLLGTALSWLGLMQSLSAFAPGGFRELLLLLLESHRGTGADDPVWSDWKGALILAAQASFGSAAEVADPVLVGDARIGLGWLRSGAQQPDVRRASVRRLVHAPSLYDSDRGQWVRCVAALTGVLTIDQVSNKDAAVFQKSGARAWKVGLEAACQSRQPVGLELLWASLADVEKAVGEGADQDRATLSNLVEQLAPAGPGLDPQNAARADLLLVARIRTLPRLRRLTSGHQLYAETLDECLGSFPTDRQRGLVEALLGQSPNAWCWEVLRTLSIRRTTVRQYALEALAERLRSSPTWLELDLDEEWTSQLAQRSGLEWLPALRDIRRLLVADAGAVELGRAVARHSGYGQVPDWLLMEIRPWLERRGFPDVDRLADALAEQAPGLHLDEYLYRAVAQGVFGPALSGQVQKFIRAQQDRWKRLDNVVRKTEPPRLTPPQVVHYEETDHRTHDFPHDPQGLPGPVGPERPAPKRWYRPWGDPGRDPRRDNALEEEW